MRHALRPIAVPVGLVAVLAGSCTAPAPAALPDAAAVTEDSGPTGGQPDVVAASDVVVPVDATAAQPDAAPSRQDVGPDTPPDVVADTPVQAGGCTADSQCPPTSSPCLVAVCTVGGTCKIFAAPAKTPCDDGNACTLGDQCLGQDCSGGPPKPCGDDNPCTADSCDPVTGSCAHTPTDGAACSDGEACTVEDACKGGVCVGVVSVCACTTTADCAKQEDGNLCNGTLYCDKSAFPFACKVNPASVVTCPVGLPNPCSVTACVPSTGQCVTSAANNGTPCDDANKCTVADTCQGGVCAPGEDTCACKTNADCASQDDGDLCNGVPFCNKAKKACEPNPASVVVCPTVEDTVCRKNQCQKDSGLCQQVDVNAGKPCLDGNPCTVGEVCQSGQCKGGVDTCVCAKDSECVGQDDGNFCNGLMFCNKATNQCEINPATVVVCQTATDTFCSQTVCKPTTGKCVAQAIHELLACDDGNPCTEGDACVSGQCVAGVDLCKCATASDCAKEEDGNACNGTLFCNKAKGKCELNPATVVNCPSVNDTACTKNLCEPKSGACVVAAVSDSTLCDADGSTCTQGDHCQGGQCVAGTKVCACAKTADCAALEDGNACNGTLYCALAAEVTQSKCVLSPATVVYCPTANDSACQKNQCQPATGKCVLQPVKDGLPCDDGSKCTKQDVCVGGSCAPLETVYCDDGLVCTDDSCKPGSGCVAVPNASPCDLDGTACTADKCKVGICLAGAATDCDDGNPCTDDLCDDKTGACAHYQKPDGAVCSDGIACTAFDNCSKGQCVAEIAPTGTPCGYQKVCNGKSCTIAVPKGFTPVPAGRFYIGGNSPPGGLGTSFVNGYRPAWSDGFFLATNETTVADYKVCVAVGKCAAPVEQPTPIPSGTAKCTWGLALNDQLPISCVTLADAESYCAATFGGRVPTIAEYVKAGRGGCEKLGAPCKVTSPNYPWGNTGLTCKPAPGNDCINLTVVGGTAGTDSPYGIHDISSNAREWIHDTKPLGFGAFPQGTLPVNIAYVGGVAAVLPGPGNGPNGYPTLCELISDNIVPTMVHGANGFRCRLPMPCDPTIAGSCNDGSPCTADSCVIGTGCVHTAAAGLCNADDNPCTFDVCNNGDCVADLNATCDDKNPCTTDNCDNVTGGCLALVLASGACTDNEPCTTGDACALGKCQGQAAAEASPCTDDDLCTSDDTCKAGKCTGTAKACGASDTCQNGQCAKPLAGFSFIPGGSYVLGCSTDKETDCKVDDQPIHQVVLSPFYLQTTEMTANAVLQCVQAGKCAPEPQGGSCTFAVPALFDPEHMPATCVSQPVAKAVCAFKFAGGRLPTEAEWEAAARGPCADPDPKVCAKLLRRYPWGDAPPVFGQVAATPYVNLKIAVGSLPAGRSPFGVLDMAGNVAEWVADSYDGAFYKTLAVTPAVKDPLFYTASPTANGVVRGGNVTATAAGLRSHVRSSDTVTKGRPLVGFRCAISASAVP